MATPEKPPAGKGGPKTILLVAVVGAVATAAGFAVPMLVLGGGHGKAPAEGEGRARPSNKTALISFGDVVVNLHDERLSRYLKVTIILVVDEGNEKPVKEALDKKKAVLKN